MKKNSRTIVLSAADVDRIINDLSLLIVSMDRIGSMYHDKPRLHAIETDKFLLKVKAFRLLARARAILTEAYNSQSSAADVARSEEAAETLPYWQSKKK